MGRFEVVIPDDDEAVFRRAAAERFGYRKGNLSAAATQAMRLWCSTYAAPKDQAHAGRKRR